LAGDADLLEPLSSLYRMHRNSAAARARALGAEGVIYPEPLKVWGLSMHADNHRLCSEEHLNHTFAMMLENGWIALHGYSTLGTDIRRDLPWIQGMVRFFDTFFRQETKKRTGREPDPDGKLCIYPANCIEYAWDAKNPVETVAALRRITDALTKLPGDLISDKGRTYFSKILAILPDLPLGEREGRRILLPAESIRNEYNTWELPELYAAWPYRLYYLTRPGTAEVAQNTWDLLRGYRAEEVRQDYSWMPVAVNMAALGNAGEAGHRILDKLGNFNKQTRFPTFFGPGHDWLPDHNWCGSGMVGLQEMLMSADPFGDGKIYLLPALANKVGCRI
jgi:hypothetical protein